MGKKVSCTYVASEIWRQFKSFFRDVGPNKGQVALVLFQMILVGATFSVIKFPESLMAGPDKQTNEFIVGNFIGSTSFLITYGFTKSISNVVVGVMSDKYGRKFPNWVGWLSGIILPIMVIFANNWGTVVASNLFLGIQQGLTWSTLLFIIIDYAGPKSRGVAVSLNEGTGYVSIALFNLAASKLVDEDKKEYRPKPFYLVLAMMGVGFLTSIFLLKDTSHLVKQKPKNETKYYTKNGGTEKHENDSVSHERNSSKFEHSFDGVEDTNIKLLGTEENKTSMQIFLDTSFRNKSLSVLCWSGMIVNAVVALAWGVFIKWMKTGSDNGNWMEFSSTDVAYAGLTFDITHGSVQYFSGLIGDLTGRKKLIVGGFALKAVTLGLLAYIGQAVKTTQTLIKFSFFFLGSMTGVGVGLVYPNIIAACCDHVEPHYRATALGTYRFWRDMGYAIGALLAGSLTQASGFPVTVGTFGALCAFTSFLVAYVYKERQHETDLGEKLVHNDKI